MRNTLKAKYSVFRTLGKQSNLRNRQKKINRRERNRKKKHTRKCIWRCWFGDIPLWSRLTTFLTLLQPSRVSIHLAGSHRLEREPCRTSWGLWIALASPLLFVRVFPFLSFLVFFFLSLLLPLLPPVALYFVCRSLIFKNMFHLFFLFLCYSLSCIFSCSYSSVLLPALPRAIIHSISFYLFLFSF